MRRILAAVVAAVVAGCGSQVPSDSPPATGLFPLACVGVVDSDCRALAEQATAGMMGTPDQPSYVAVGPGTCSEPCPPGAVEGVLRVEYASDRRPDMFEFSVFGGHTSVTLIDSVHSRMEPTSGRALGQELRIQLGHCGFNSGIDVDGSHWDPVGAIDPDHPDALNSAGATFSFTSPNTATLRTEGGLVVRLVRHVGPKWLPGCD
jgi:hypothetical protein